LLPTFNTYFILDLMVIAFILIACNGLV